MDIRDVPSEKGSYQGKSQGEYANASAFAAIRSDGSVVTWGGGLSGAGGDSSAVASQLDGTIDVVEVFSASLAFAALRADGSVVTWGSSSAGGNSSAVASRLDGSIDVVEVFSTGTAFAALRADGSVVTWGDGSSGGNSSAVASQLDGSIDVVKVFATYGAFAALRADGSVVTWGGDLYGGTSGAVASQLNGAIDVADVFATFSAFAALRTDGSVVTWGNALTGGDSSAVASQLQDVVAFSDIYSSSIPSVVMPPLSSINLQEKFLADRGISGLSSAMQKVLGARLDQMQEAGVFSNFQIAMVLAANAIIRASVPEGVNVLPDIAASVASARAWLEGSAAAQQGPAQAAVVGMQFEASLVGLGADASTFDALII